VQHGVKAAEPIVTAPTYQITAMVMIQPGNATAMRSSTRNDTTTIAVREARSGR